MATTAPTPVSTPTAAPAQQRRGMSIRTKFLVLALTTGTAVLAIIAYFAYAQSRRTLVVENASKLRALRTTLATNVERFFRQARVNVVARADDRVTLEALTAFTQGRRTLLNDLQSGGVTLDDAFWKRVTDQTRDYYERTLIRGLTAVRGGKPAETAANLLPKDRASLLLQYVYIVANPAKPDEKEKGNLPEDIQTYPLLEDLGTFRTVFARTPYAQTVARYQPVFANNVNLLGYRDLILLAADGTVVYSYGKGLDYAANFRSAPNKSTPLGKAFLSAWFIPTDANANVNVRATLSDMEPFTLDGDTAASFGATAIFDETGRKVGVFAARINTAPLNALFRFDNREEEVGLGRTGSAFMVGPDLKMRNEFRFAPIAPDGTRPVVNRAGDVIGKTTVRQYYIDTPTAKGVFAANDPNGNIGLSNYVNKRGEETIGSFGPVGVPGLDYGVVVAITTAEGTAAARQLGNSIATISGVTLLLLALGSFLAANRFTRPILALENAASRIAAGESEVRATVSSRDEIGALATTFNTMNERTSQANKVIAESAKKASDENQRTQDDLFQFLQVVDSAGQGDTTIRAKVSDGPVGLMGDAFNAMMETFGGALAQSKKAAATVRDGAERNREGANTLALAAEQQAGQLEETQQSAEQLAHSSTEVSERSSATLEQTILALDSAKRGEEIVQQVVKGMRLLQHQSALSGKRVKKVAENVNSIETVLRDIREIAARTDDLAMNASIAAAQSSEGSGFQGVADEIRRLAERQGVLVREAAEVITNINRETQQAVVAIESQTAEVENQATIVGTAGVALQEITQAVDNTSAYVRQIDTAAKQQTETATSAATAIGNASSFAGETVSVSRQSAADSQQVADLSKGLLERLVQFKTTEDAG